MHRSALFIVCVAVLLSGCDSAPSRRRAAATISLDEGNHPPDPALVAWLASQGVSREAVLIQFGWAHDSDDDRVLAEMIALHQAETHEGLKYLRVDMSGDIGAARGILDGKDLPFPVDYDADRSATRLFGIGERSRIALVGKFGRIRYRGPFPADTLDEWAEALVAEIVDPGARVPMFGSEELEADRLLVSTRLPSLGEPTALLSKHFGANGLAIVFVDTACPYAGIAINDLSAVAPTLGMLGVPVVAVNLDDPEDAVTEFFADKGLNVPLMFDTTIGTRLRWGIDSVPTVVYVDAAGEIRYKGPAIWADVGAAVAHGVKANQVQFSTPGTGYG